MILMQCKKAGQHEKASQTGEKKESCKGYCNKLQTEVQFMPIFFCIVCNDITYALGSLAE